MGGGEAVVGRRERRRSKQRGTPYKKRNMSKQAIGLGRVGEEGICQSRRTRKNAREKAISKNSGLTILSKAGPG